MTPSYRLVLAAAAASGLALWLASPAVGLGWLAWVALAPVACVVVAWPGERPARAAVPLTYAIYLWLLLLPAFPFGVAEGQWGTPALPVLIADSPVIAIALVGVPLIAAILHVTGFGLPWGASRLAAAAAATAAIAVPALAWTALDFARSSLDPSALWGPLFLSQVGSPTASMAALGGPWLITFAIVAVNYGIALALVRRRPAIAAVVAAAVAVLVIAGLAAERGEGSRSLRVAAIQPGYDTAESERPELRNWARGTYDLAARDLIRDLGELTAEAAGEGAELVVWPEASMYVDPRREAEVRADLERLASATGVAIVVPFFLPRPVATGEVLVVEPFGGGARLTETRPKHRPLWFLGERQAAGEPGTLDAAGVRTGPLFGTDTLDPGNGAALARDGAELLASFTHDWRQSAVAARTWGQLSARAAGRPLVRADWRYASAIYGSRGSVEAEADPGRERLALVADVRLGGPTTPYTRIGDLVAWTAVAAIALLALAAFVRGPLSRAVGRGAGDREPRRGSPPRRRGRGQPRAADAPTRPPP